MTRAVADDLAARRRRAVASRSATTAPAAPVQQDARPAEVHLVVLLPSTDAATVLLLCGDAAELIG